MAERPILFSGPMVRALLDGRKTHTRRVVKPDAKWAARFPICNPSGMKAGHEVWWWDGKFDRVGASQTCRYGVAGDRLWVKEAHYLTDNGDEEFAVYAADEAEVGRHLKHVASLERAHRDIDWSRHRKLRPSIHMPRWASRLTLDITDVRVERLQEISEADAAAEGLMTWQGLDCDGDPRLDGRMYHFTAWGWQKPEKETDGFMSAYAAYRDLWEAINGPGSWDANPWVWVVSFEVEPRP